VILHAGSFSDRSVAGTVSPGGPLRRLLRDRLEYRNRDFDLTAHSPVPVFRALALLRERRPEVRGRIEFRLAGRIPAAWREVAASFGVAEALKLTGPLLHADAVREMRGADLLFAPEIVRRSGGRVSCVSQKVYEYLRTGSPVLSTGGPGDTRDLIREAEAGGSFTPDDAVAIAEFVARHVDHRATAPAPRADVVARFDRRRLTERLAETFRAALEDRRRP
jgi:glycosyltransferase involved in cell wall biosynthesis